MTRKKSRRGKALADPHAAREAARYEHPIPSREALLSFLEQQPELMKLEHIAEALELTGERDLSALDRRLGAMTRAGQLIRNRRGGYGLPQRMDLVRGRLIANPDGFGFLRPDAGGEDIYLSPREMRRVLHGDKLLVSVTKVDHRGRKEGAVVEILERANQYIVGRYYEESGVGFVVADEKRIHQDILISPGEAGDAHHGQIVYVEVTAQPDFRKQPVGRVIQVLGDVADPGMAVEIALRSYDLPFEWPEALDQELEALPERVEGDRHGEREDIRNLPLVTIDGADARDFDDAVWCEPDGQGWRLIVAIADVSHYVREGSVLDEEAYTRGTSVYFPNRVIPMLPERLSNDLCSLRPDEDRLCMVCDMRISSDGETQGYRFYPALMRSHARLTYEQVEAVLNGDKKGQQRCAHVLGEIENLRGVFEVLLSQRRQRGAIDFDSSEPTFRFDDQGEVAEVHARERLESHKLIEECMIAANVCAARFLEKHEAPGPFRVHETPSVEKLEDVRVFLAELGLRFKAGENTEPKDFAQIIEMVKDRPDSHLIQMVLLRAQMMATYQPDNKGHFGLALEAYAHFTSPIRRYPDLLVHRGIRAILDRKDQAGRSYNAAQMDEMTEHCSDTERRAEEASRDVDDRLKCLWLKRHEGDQFEGTVAGVTSFGLFVELDDNLIQGLVHVTQLPNDYFHFDPVHHTLSGERSGLRYRLSDRVKVEVLRVDPEERKIDLRLITPERYRRDGESAKGDKPRRGGRKRGGRGKRR